MNIVERAGRSEIPFADGRDGHDQNLSLPGGIAAHLCKGSKGEAASVVAVLARVGQPPDGRDGPGQNQNLSLPAASRPTFAKEAKVGQPQLWLFWQRWMGGTARGKIKTSRYR